MARSRVISPGTQIYSRAEWYIVAALHGLASPKDLRTNGHVPLAKDKTKVLPKCQSEQLIAVDPTSQQVLGSTYRVEETDARGNST